MALDGKPIKNKAKICFFVVLKQETNSNKRGMKKKGAMLPKSLCNKIGCDCPGITNGKEIAKVKTAKKPRKKILYL